MDKAKNAEIVLLAHSYQDGQNSLQQHLLVRKLAFKGGVNITELRDLLRGNATSNKSSCSALEISVPRPLEVTGKVLANSLDVLAVIGALKGAGDKELCAPRGSVQ